MNELYLTRTESGIHLSMVNLDISVGMDRITFAHLGCKLARPLKNRKEGSATQKVADTLKLATRQSSLDGVDLWDTMRRGSDYWRPGKLLSDVAEHMRTSGFEVSYRREDSVCPPADLLASFMKKDDISPMTFGDYAEEYAQYLKNKGGIKEAAAGVIMALARKRLAVFYCVDPYVPDYVDSALFLASEYVPYRERKWRLDMREEGCHRVILTEEISRFFLELGMPIRLLEIDQTNNHVAVRDRQ